MNFGRSYFLSVLLSLFVFTNLFADNYYWVENSGDWNDPSHWASTSGGNGGVGVPEKNDNVFFDVNSFTSYGSVVNIQTDISVHHLTIDDANLDFTIKSNQNTTITIYGNLLTPKVFNNELKSDIHFKSNSSPTNLDFGWGTWNSNIYFEGNGSYLLNGPLTNPAKNVTLVSGSLDLNENDLRCSSFIANSNKKKNISAEGSMIIVHNQWITSPNKFSHDFALSQIHSLNYSFNSIDQGGEFFPIQQAKGPNDKTITVTSMITDTASCGDQCDGVIIVNWTSSCPNSFVNWSPGTPLGDNDGVNPITNGSDTIFNICPGIEYTAVITNDCDGSVAFPKATVLGHSLITLPIPPIITETSCKGVCDGEITAFIDAAGFALPYLTYQWTPGGPADTNTTYSNLCAGSYDLRVLDGFGCDTTFTIIVPEPDSIHANVTVTNPPCYGYCDGSITSNPIGGTPPYSYAWTPATGNPALDTVATFSNLCDSTAYTVTITDVNNCTNDTTVTLTEPPQLQIDTVLQHVSCGGLCDGIITTTVLSGGVPPYTHNWSTGQVDIGAVSTVSNLCIGTYTDTIVDANGCDTIFTFTITEPSILTTSTTTTDVTCFGTCDGTATTFPVGGAGGYTYSWSCGPSTFDSIAGLCLTAQCIVTVTDQNSCTVQDTFSINEPPLLVVNPSSTNISCPGFCDGTATVAPTGGTGNPAVDYTYTWTGPGGPYNTQSIASLCPGTYICTVVDSFGCTSIDSVVVTQPPFLNLVTNFTDESCDVSCDGTAGVSVTGGYSPYTYLWTSVPAGQVGPGQGTDSIWNLCAGDYTIIITDSAGCTDNATVTLTPQSPIAANLTTTDVSCNGSCNGTATVTPTGGNGPYTVSWDGGAPIAIPIAGSNTITGLCEILPAQHTALITDNNGCTLLLNFDIFQPTALTTITNSTDVSCFGFCDGTANTSPAGGTPPYVYSWDSIPAGGAPFPVAGNPITSLCGGTYYVTITDDSLCTVNDTIVINEPTQILPNVDSTNISCNGLNDGSAISLPTGGAPGYSFNWTGPGGPYTSQSIGSLSAGQYIVTVTDTNGCTGIDTVNIIDPLPLSVNANATNASCGTVCDGTALATPNGGTPGYTYSWNTVPAQPTQIANGLCAGTYTVTVTDTNGCTAQDTTVISNIVVIGINTTAVGLSCNGVCDGTATAVPSGGLAPYTYQWYGNNTNPNDTLITVDSLCPGWVYVIVTDANGCASTDSVFMPIAPPVLFPNGSIDQQISCNGACDAMVSSSPSGGTPPYVSVWTIPGGIDTNNVCPPYAVITVTDASNCVQSDTLFINEPDTITPNDVVSNVSCNGDSTGSITLNPTGGAGGTYSYTWIPNVSSGSSATNLPAGAYLITITDSNGCFIDVFDTITEPTFFSSNPIGIDISCNGACDGIMAVTVNGGVPPYTYIWGNNQPVPPASQDTLFNVCPPFLSNSVTIVDSNGCISTQNITINEPTMLSVIMSGTPIGCSSNCDGTALATPNGGTPGYTYQWTINAAPNPLNAPGISNLCADTFTVVVTDTNGCTANGQYIVTEPTSLSVTLDSTNVTCNGDNNGTATATPTGGTPPYSYSWVGGCLPSPATTSSITGLCPGIYTVTVTDSANCIYIGSVNITEPQPIDDNEVVTGANCGVADGTIIMFPSGGTPPYTHSWSNGVTTPNNPNLVAGFYTDTITDAVGCVAIFTIAVSNPTGPSGVTATVNDATCYGACDGSLNTIPIGGNPPFTYAWSSIPPGGPYPNDSTLTGLCAGTYNLTLTDAANCVLASSVLVGQADSISANSTFTAVSCTGNCDGTASVTPTGGTPPYTFVWSHDGSTASSASNLCIGAVNVTVTDFNGCTKVVGFNITSPNVLTVSSNTTNTTCNGSCDGTATVTPGGGTGPYNYQWNDPLAQTTQTATGLCAGTYIVTVSDFNGCSGNDTVVITEPTPIIPNDVTTPATCGLCDGTASVAASAGGTGIHTYFWPNFGATTPTINGLCAGTDSVIITDGNGCSQTFLIAISNVNGPTVSVNTTNASCNGVCDGQATATVTSGTPNYQYLWATGGQTTSTVAGLCAGNYTVQVTDGNGCITVEPVTITDNSLITATVTTIDATCNGVCDGSALVIPSGGVPPYSYNWNTGHTINAVGGLCAGNYTVTITDALGCTLIQNVTINEPNILTVTTSGIAANCNGSCDGQATVTPTGGTGPYTYLWSTGATTPTITAVCAGNYTVTVTDFNGCTANGNVTIGEGVTITAGIVTTDANCGQCDGSITITPGGGAGGPYTLLWSPGGQITNTINNLCPGAYDVDVTDNVGCMQTFNVIINNANGPTLSTQADSVTCFGSCDGLAWTDVIVGNPNYIFQWDDPLLQNTDSATALCAGLYNIIVQDSLGCVTVDSITVPTPAQIMANLTSTPPSCPGACDGSATVTPTGGVGNYTVSWDGGAPIVVAMGGSNTITGLCNGTHTALITDANGCSELDSVILSAPNVISITISSTPVSCNGGCDGTALATGSGGTPGYQYSWNTTPIQNSSLATSLCAGTHIVTVTDNNGCSDTASVVVVDPPVLTTSSVPTPATCNGVCDGSITTTPGGGVPPYTYVWNNGDTSQTTSNLCPGVYDVTVIDANNCTAYDTITLTAPVVLNDSTVVNGPTCGACDGSATSTPVGGVGPFDFVWTSTVSPFPVLQTDLGVASSTVTGLCAGTVDLQITDLGSGCIGNYTILVNSITGPTLTLSSTDETCPNVCDGTATVNASGTIPPYSYSWNTVPVDTNQTATNLCVGTYTVTVTDNGNCVSVDTISIFSMSLNLSITNIVPETCFGDCDGYAIVSVAGGTPNYSYIWNPTSQTTATAANLCVGNYMVTVTDSTNCSDSISANVSGPDLLTVAANVNTPISCNGVCDGVAIANAVGGTPNYTYSWNDPMNQTTQIATGLCAGTYIVTITDDNGCTAIDSVTLTEPTPILANETLGLPACGACDGSITVSPTGGTGLYTFLWTTPTAPPAPQPITATLINLCAGAYTLAITDSTGCIANFNFPLSNTNAPTPNTTVTNASCNGMCDGQIIAAPTGGTGPYTYFWGPGGATTPVVTNLCAGQYTLDVTDSLGCIGIAIDSVTEPAVLQANINSTDVFCNGSCDGWAVSNTMGGTPGYSYSWSPGGLTQDSITSLCPGTYTVTVTDTNNCIVVDSVVITEPNQITTTSTQIDVSCTAVCDGEATVTPSGGIGPYVFEWNGNTLPGQTSTETGLCFGLNMVVITDQNGCSITDSVYIGATDTVLADAGNDSTICLGSSLNLIGTPTGNFTSVEWFELSGMISIGTTDTVSITPSAIGVTCYVYQVNGACVYTDTVCITVNQLPTADAGPDVTIFELASTTLTATGGFTYSWTPGAGLSDSTIANPVASPMVTTTYYVTVTSPNGCTSMDSVIVTVLPNITFPDGITPNGDGKNDVWIIDFIEQFPNNVVEVYNRWGELLFHADGYQQDWDGTYNGKELPIGTYYYIIDLHEESLKPFTGPITILR